MFKKQPAAAQDNSKWNDIGAAWDNLVASDEDDGLAQEDEPLPISVPVPTALKGPLTANDEESGSGSSATSTLKTEADIANGIAGMRLEVPSMEDSSNGGSNRPERGRSPMKIPIQGHALGLPLYVSFVILSVPSLTLILFQTHSSPIYHRRINYTHLHCRSQISPSSSEQTAAVVRIAYQAEAEGAGLDESKIGFIQIETWQ